MLNQTSSCLVPRPPLIQLLLFLVGVSAEVAAWSVAVALLLSEIFTWKLVGLVAVVDMEKADMSVHSQGPVEVYL